MLVHHQPSFFSVNGQLSIINVIEGVSILSQPPFKPRSHICELGDTVICDGQNPSIAKVVSDKLGKNKAGDSVRSGCMMVLRSSSDTSKLFEDSCNTNQTAQWVSRSG